MNKNITNVLNKRLGKSIFNRIDVFTDQDLLAAILSPHTTPDQKRDAKAERDRRQKDAAME
mgnify:CR=1 FL=1